MAKLSPTSMMHGASGKVGGLVFRQVHGETIVQGYREPRMKRSALQLVFNNKMRMASFHARAALANPAVKAHYEKKKRRLNVSSAYTAACTDFLRHGRIDTVDTSKYDKGIIMVKAFKADLGLEEVAVTIKLPDGSAVVQGKAIDKGEGQWMFRSSVPLPRLEDAIITVSAKDKTGNMTRVVREFDKPGLFFHDWPGAPHLAG